jgi:hypothetical protein
MFTAAQIREILRYYWNKWPDTPSEFHDPTEFRPAKEDENFFCRDGCVGTAQFDFQTESVLILKPKPKRYRFICDDPTPRRIKIGDWTAKYNMNVHPYAEDWVEVTASNIKFFLDPLCIIFRREEIID